MNKKIVRILTQNEKNLINSKKDFNSIFEIMFSAKDNILCEGNDGFRVYKHTYGSIYNRIISTAACLFEKLGATHSYIALEMDNGPDWIVAFWSILMSGNKPYLVNLRYPAALTQGILKTLNVKYILSDKVGNLNSEYITIDSLKGDFSPVPKEMFEDEIAFSSSATSMNEVICFYSGYQVSEQILNFKTIVKQNPRIAKHYKSELKQLAFLPFYHVFGLFAVYFWFTFFGTTLVFLKDYSADTILKTCRKHNVTHIFAVPMLWHTIEKQVWAAAEKSGERYVKKLKRGIKFTTKLQNIFPNLGAAVAKRMTSQVTDKLFGRSVMFCISGGSYLRDSALELINGIGYNLRNGFGMSEVGITSVELRKKAKHLNENSIGRPFDSVEYKLSDDNELYIKGTSLCKRKLINGEETAFDGWFKTGDIVENRGGNYFILGRKSDVVIGESGENINPDIIEKLFSSSSAKALSVLGLQGDDGEKLSMVIGVSRYTTPQRLAEIRDEMYAINSALPPASSVKRFYFTFEDLAPPTAIKVSRTGVMRKITHGEINLIPFGEIDADASAETEETPLYKKVRAIIAEALNIPEDKIVPSSHLFYDLGASSIQYFSILSLLAEQFSIENYSKEDSYRYTVKEMCEYIERHL